MDAENIINQYNASKAQTMKLHDELRKYQLEAAMRAYEALRDAYNCGVVICDDDRVIRSSELFPCEPFNGLHGTDCNGNVMLRFTHDEENPYFVPKDFPTM